MIAQEEPSHYWTCNNFTTGCQSQPGWTWPSRTSNHPDTKWAVFGALWSFHAKAAVARVLPSSTGQSFGQRDAPGQGTSFISSTLRTDATRTKPAVLEEGFELPRRKFR